MENLNTKITFDETGFAVSSGFIKTYDVDSNNIYIGSNATYVTEGFGLPAGSFLNEPDRVAGKNEAIIRTIVGWAVTPDFRGQIFYSKEDGSEVEIKEVGAVSDELTDKQYPGQFYNWDDSDWVFNIEEQTAETVRKNKDKQLSLSTEAEDKILILERKIKAKRATDAEKQLLIALCDFTIDLDELDLTQEMIDWPTRPE